MACLGCSASTPKGERPPPQAAETATPKPTATRIPSPTPTPCEHKYTTQPGDTLWGIGESFGTTVQAIQERNRLQSDRIWSGTELWIPCGAAVPSASGGPGPTPTSTAPPRPSPTPTPPRPSPTPTIHGCPNGCTYHKSGCDIKGNISIDTREKIYHVPGGEYYEETIIRPEYGERWFCTEQEAIDNGWRRSKV